MTDPTTTETLGFADQALLWLKLNTVSIAGAFAVLVIGLIIANLLSRWADKALRRQKRFDEAVTRLLSKMVKYVLWAVVLLTVLAQFGVETTSILAALGGMALAIGLALQGTFSNIASGVMILIHRPFKVGEGITNGSVTGVVQNIGLFTTELKQFDGLFVMVPNTEIWSKAVTNFNRHPVRRFELIVGIGYEDSMADARANLLELAAADGRILPDPAPLTFVNSLDESSVGIGLRVWCATADYWGVAWDMTEAAKARFDDKGISIPFPQREITQRAG